MARVILSLLVLLVPMVVALQVSRNGPKAPITEVMSPFRQYDPIRAIMDFLSNSVSNTFAPLTHEGVEDLGSVDYHPTMSKPSR